MTTKDVQPHLRRVELNVPAQVARGYAVTAVHMTRASNSTSGMTILNLQSCKLITMLYLYAKIPLNNDIKIWFTVRPQETAEKNPKLSPWLPLRFLHPLAILNSNELCITCHLSSQSRPLEQLWPESLRVPRVMGCWLHLSQ